VSSPRLWNQPTLVLRSALSDLDHFRLPQIHRKIAEQRAGNNAFSRFYAFTVQQPDGKNGAARASRAATYHGATTAADAAANVAASTHAAADDPDAADAADAPAAIILADTAFASQHPPTGICNAGDASE
jgi:hypothetical protein